MALVDGTTYVTRQVRQRLAQIGDHVVCLHDRKVELRVRNTASRALFIATKYHDAARPENDSRTKSIITSAASRLLVDDELARYALDIRRHIHPDIRAGL